MNKIEVLPEYDNKVIDGSMVFAVHQNEHLKHGLFLIKHDIYNDEVEYISSIDIYDEYVNQNLSIPDTNTTFNLPNRKPRRKGTVGAMQAFSGYFSSHYIFKGSDCIGICFVKQ